MLVALLVLSVLALGLACYSQWHANHCVRDVSPWVGDRVRLGSAGHIEVRRIASATRTTITIDRPWTVMPGEVWLVTRYKENRK